MPLAFTHSQSLLLARFAFSTPACCNHGDDARRTQPRKAGYKSSLHTSLENTPRVLSKSCPVKLNGIISGLKYFAQPQVALLATSFMLYLARFTHHLVLLSLQWVYTKKNLVIGGIYESGCRPPWGRRGVASGKLSVDPYSRSSV